MSAVNDPVQDIQIEETPEEILIEATSVAKEEKFLDQMMGQEEVHYDIQNNLSYDFVSTVLSIYHMSHKQFIPIQYFLTLWK